MSRTKLCRLKRETDFQLPDGPLGGRLLRLWRSYPQAQPLSTEVRAHSRHQATRFQNQMTGFERYVRHPYAALLLLLAATFACQASQPGGATANSGSRVASDAPRTSGVSRDLSQDEAAGGHTLRKHVGRTDDQLRERLRHEHNISAASAWNDRETAERAVGIALQQNRDKIDRWLNRSGGHPNLVIDYDGDSSHPIGRPLHRDAGEPQPCAHATIVLKWTGPNDYYVLTSYPECR